MCTKFQQDLSMHARVIAIFAKCAKEEGEGGGKKKRKKFL